MKSKHPINRLFDPNATPKPTIITQKRTSQHPGTTRKATPAITRQRATEPKKFPKHRRPVQASPLICEVLESKRYEGDGPPHWRVGRNNKPCQIAKEAEEQRRRLIKRLRRRGKENRTALALAHRLESCHRRSRCKSGACPVCLRVIQRWFVTIGFRFLTQLETEVAVLSIVPDDLRVPVGQLSPNFLVTMASRIENALRKSVVSTIIGGFDFSVNEHEDEDFEPYHQPQFWALLPLTQAREADEKLRARFPATDTTPRPVKVLKWNGKRRALTYALKSNFARRVSYFREAREDGFRHGCWNTRDRFLRVQQEIELMIALDRAGLDARLLMRGAHIRRTANGPMIRPITCSPDL